MRFREFQPNLFDEVRQLCLVKILTDSPLNSSDVIKWIRVDSSKFVHDTCLSGVCVCTQFVKFWITSEAEWPEFNAKSSWFGNDPITPNMQTGVISQ